MERKSIFRNLSRRIKSKSIILRKEQRGGTYLTILQGHGIKNTMVQKRVRRPRAIKCPETYMLLGVSVPDVQEKSTTISGDRVSC